MGKLSDFFSTSRNEFWASMIIVAVAVVAGATAYFVRTRPVETPNYEKEMAAFELQLDSLAAADSVAAKAKKNKKAGPGNEPSVKSAELPVAAV